MSITHSCAWCGVDMRATAEETAKHRDLCPNGGDSVIFAPKIEIGNKFDQDKLCYDLIPPTVLDSVIRVLMHGAEKYGPYNWMLVQDAKSRYSNALWRHFEKYRIGNRFDEDTGLNHMAHIICCAMFLLYLDNDESTASACPETDE